MRSAFVVTYDICDPKRLREVFRIMKGYGEHLQLSVFRCELDARELVELRAALRRIVHDGEDQVLFVEMGPVEGRGRECITSLGLPYIPPDDNPIIA